MMAHIFTDTWSCTAVDKREKGQLECALEKSNGVKPASRRKIATEDSMIELSSGGNDNVNGTVGVV